MEDSDAPAPASISSKAGPAARVTCPWMESGLVMQFFLEAKAPASHASANTTTFASLMLFLISRMNSELLRRFARSWLRTSPGISVAENSGCRPEA